LIIKNLYYILILNKKKKSLILKIIKNIFFNILKLIKRIIKIKNYKYITKIKDFKKLDFNLSNNKKLNLKESFLKYKIKTNKNKIYIKYIKIKKKILKELKILN
jgi:hypothetical protein